MWGQRNLSHHPQPWSGCRFSSRGNTILLTSSPPTGKIRRPIKTWVYKKKNEQPGPKSFCCSSPLSTAVRTRLELATPCVTGMYSNLLNYRTSVLIAIDVSRLRVQSYEHFLILQNFAAKNFNFFFAKNAYFSIIRVRRLILRSVSS